MRMILAAIGLAATASIAFTPHMAPAAEPIVAPPVMHDNLAVFFLRGASAPGPVPLTLREALAKGVAVVRETGSVERLEIENTGTEAVFVQAGDIVKGGKQDRVLTVSLLVPAKSGPMPIGAYCVEQGRWRARGTERVDRFASSDNYLPSKRAKMALAVAALTPAPERRQGAAATPAASPLAGRNVEQRQSAGASSAIQSNRVPPFAVGGAPRTTTLPQSASRQSEVWASVAEVQAKLSNNVGARVESKTSASSLQLALENEKLASRRQAYLAAIEPAARGDDILGVVIAINGRVVSGELYPSNGLFRKMWPKLAEAAAIEAIGEVKSKLEPAAPITRADIADVRALLSETAQAKANVVDVDKSLKRDARDSAKGIAVSTLAADGRLLHRSYIAK